MSLSPSFQTRGLLAGRSGLPISSLLGNSVLETKKSIAPHAIVVAQQAPLLSALRLSQGRRPLSLSRLLQFSLYAGLLATCSGVFDYPLIGALIIERVPAGEELTLASSKPDSQIRPSSPPVDPLGLQPEATPVCVCTSDASRHVVGPEH
jgi:hypothetical protein